MCQFRVGLGFDTRRSFSCTQGDAHNCGRIHEYLESFEEDYPNPGLLVTTLQSWLSEELPFENGDYESWMDLFQNIEDWGCPEENMPAWARSHFFEDETSDMPLEAYIAMLTADDTDSEEPEHKCFKLLNYIADDLIFEDGPASPENPTRKRQRGGGLVH